MRLESALYTSKEGLNVHGQAISVIGDNISNVNTVGYKASRSEFSDLVSDGEGRESYAVQGLGSGVAVSRIRQIHDTGVIEFTGRSLDVAIGGRGFFMVGDPANPSYTRAGNFEINETGLLVDSRGQPVLGTSGVIGEDGEAGALTTLNLLNVEIGGRATTAAALTANLNAVGAAVEPLADPLTFRQLSQVASFMGSMSVYDSLGAEHTLNIAFYKTANNTWTARAYVDGADVGQEPGRPIQVGETVVNFGENGLIPEENAANTAMNINIPYANGSAAGNLILNMGNLTQYAAASQFYGVTQDGQGTGQITGYEFKKDGRLSAVLSSGEQVLIGTLQLADFTNMDGLQRIGNNLYVQGEGVGAKNPAAPGTAGLGELEGSSLERSTVDLANQFVELTLFQRGYQANSQILSVASSMIRDTLGLLR